MKTKVCLPVLALMLASPMASLWAQGQVIRPPLKTVGGIGPIGPVRPLPPIKPSAPQALDQKSLGTIKDRAGIYSKDLASLTRMALPNYSEELLAKHFASTARKFIQGEKGLIIDPRAIEGLLKIKIGNDREEETDEYRYELNPKMGKVSIHRNLEKMSVLSLEKGREEMKQSGQLFLGALKSFGIDPGQLYGLNTRMSLLEGVQKLGEGKYAAPTRPVVDGLMAYGQRVVDGIIVEGSRVKLLAKDARTLEGVQLVWPKFLFHKDLQKFELKPKNQVLEEALMHLKKVANSKLESNVKMAVVYRPVLVGAETMFIPAIKVGLYSRPSGDKLADEKAEAGELFYVDLLAQSVSYTVPVERETMQGGEG